MDEAIKNALDDEILKQFEDLKVLEAGSEEQEAAVENITKLYKLRLEEAKADADWDEICDQREKAEQHESDELEKQNREEQFRKEQLAEQAKERYFKLGVDVAGMILPLMFYAVWMRMGFRFEETGTYTSTTFKGLFSRFKPTRK